MNVIEKNKKKVLIKLENLGKFYSIFLLPFYFDFKVKGK